MNLGATPRCTSERAQNVEADARPHHRTRTPEAAAPDSPDANARGPIASSMLPHRYSSLFRSRWRAVFWAAGICFSAVTFVGFGPDDAGNSDATPAAGAGTSDDQSVQRLQSLIAQLEK